MKSFLKKLGIFVLVLITLLVGVWYFYYWKRFSTLQDFDKQLILKSFKPDSNEKGYSDEGEELISKDIPLIKKELSEKDAEDFIFWNREFLKRRRIMLLSENRDKFLKNAKNYYISFNCMTRHYAKLESENYAFKIEENEEEPVFFNYKELLIEKNFRFLDSKEIFNIQNPIEDYELDKCFNYFRNVK